MFLCNTITTKTRICVTLSGINKVFCETFAKKHELLQCSIEDQYKCTAEAQNVLEYENEKYDSQISNLIENTRKQNINIKFTCTSVQFRGICYKKYMNVCVGKNVCGNFIICKIELILLNEDYSDVFFIGSTREIVS